MVKQDNEWNNLYANYIKEDFKNWDEYFKTKMKLKKRFLKLVIKYSQNGKPVLECGCGTGKFAAYLASLGLDSYAMDLETAMVEQSKQLSISVSPNNPVKVFQGDISNIPFDDKFFSVTHSSGVFEHYSDSKIVELINEQLRVADICIFSVPTPYFEKKMLGNERFMRRKQWREIISQSNAKIIRETGYHYKTFSKRVLDILKKPKRLFKPIALYTFVLEEKGENKK